MNIRLTQSQKIKVLCASQLYAIMQRILLRESKVDRNREHFWTISLDNASRILNIELVSKGTVNQTLVAPMEVFSMPLQKRAVQLILVHNHPSGELQPSMGDKNTTDRLIQIGHLLQLPIIDHLIISEKSYYSFLDNGLIEELQNSTRHLPAYQLKKRYKQEAEQLIQRKVSRKTIKHIALQMEDRGLDLEIIKELTGLSKAAINKLK